MISVREYHEEAIRYTQLAAAASHRGEDEKRVQFIHSAMTYETQAADLVPEEKSSEPTRSILYRSAASFAYQAGDYQEAERLVFKGLAGYPTPLLKQQLLEVQQMIHQALNLQSDPSKNVQLPLYEKVIAIYENGALHPMVALPLIERQKVEIQGMVQIDQNYLYK